MESLGLKMGPAFPAQQPLSADSLRQQREGIGRSGIFEWTDWSEELWEAQLQSAASEPAGA